MIDKIKEKCKKKVDKGVFYDDGKNADGRFGYSMDNKKEDNHKDSDDVIYHDLSKSVRPLN